MVTTKIKNCVISFFKDTLPEKKEKLKTFFDNNYVVTSTKKLKITGTVVAAVLMLTVMFFSNQFIHLENRAKWLFLAISLIAPTLIGLSIAYTVRLKKERANKIWHFVFFFLMPIVTMTMTEILNNVFIYDMTYLGFFANYIVILLFQFIVFAICGSFRFAYLIPNTVCFGFALTHCYISSLRGVPFTPWDFLSIETAANVANTYKYTPNHLVIMGSLLYIFIIVFSLKTQTPKYNIITKVVSRTFMSSFFSCVMALFYFTTIFSEAGVNPDFWSQVRGYRNYGFVFSFFCNTKYLRFTPPPGYSPDNIDGYFKDIDSEKDNKNENSNVGSVITPSEKAPNIICIMNESLSDLKVLGDFETNIDYMPFMRSLTENTIRGNLYVPVIGGGTSNSEFEFLTGHTTAFFQPGSNAYMLYVKNPLASLVSTLEAQGYSSSAFHPYYSSGWNRVSVYEHLGFNSFKTIENLFDNEFYNEYYKNGNDAAYLQELIESRYPDRTNMLIRQYISDEYDYNILINDFENRDKTKPYFTFNITMQNHGGYNLGEGNFDECIQIKSPVYYNKASKYLSLVKASDDAFKNLIEYFKNVDEPTIICMFGDHQPSVETEFVSSLLGVPTINDVTLKQEQDRHVTPFFIWANYDIEEKQIDKLSINYLSSYLLDVAGLKLTDYNRYMLNLSKKIPVINTVGYIDANNNYYKWSDTTEYTELLNEYEQIQYNNLIDYDHRQNHRFFLEGYVMPEVLAKNSETEEK